MRLLVCGDRNWKDETPIMSFLKELPPSTVIIHGACRGVDKLSGFVAKKLGMEVLPFPSKWKRYGLGAGMIRNQQMLDEGKPGDILPALKYGASSGKELRS